MTSNRIPATAKVTLTHEAAERLGLVAWDPEARPRLTLTLTISDEPYQMRPTRVDVDQWGVEVWLVEVAP